jgi:Ion channel
MHRLLEQLLHILKSIGDSFIVFSYVLFIIGFPTMVVSDPALRQRTSGIVIVLITQVSMWGSIIWLMISVAGRLYGFGALMDVPLPLPGQVKVADLSWRGVVILVLVSYLLAIYGFALAYTFLSALKPNSFNVELDLFSASYFSLSAISTVGFGDIVPKTRLAQVLVMSEILVGLSYAIFAFSLIATVSRERRL